MQLQTASDLRTSLVSAKAPQDGAALCNKKELLGLQMVLMKGQKRTSGLFFSDNTELHQEHWLFKEVTIAIAFFFFF